MHGTGDVWFFDRFAPVYDLVVPPTNPGALETTFDRADRDIERVINIGGNSGRAALALDVPRRIVLDRSAGMLRRAHGWGLDCVHGDAREPPFADDSLDAMTVVDAFHHMPNQRGVAKEVFHMLALGRVFTVNEFSPEVLLGRGLVATERVVGLGPAFATPDELVRFLEHVGFEVAMVERGFEYMVIGKERESHQRGDESTPMAISTSFLEERLDAGTLPIAAGNVLAISFPVTVGVTQHNGVLYSSVDPVGWVLTAVPFLIGWFFIAPLLDACSPDAAEPAKSAVPLGVRLWFAATVVGMAIRWTSLFEDGAESTSVVVMLILGSVVPGVRRTLYFELV